MADVVVIGSINMDLVVKTNRMPLPGETLHGEDLQMIPGGKGANQAAAVAKLGVDVAMVGRVGNDIFGQKLIEGLSTTGVNTDCVFTELNSISGTALIIVDQNGQNSIVVSPGANAKVSQADILANEWLLSQSKILLLQFEIPIDVVNYAVEIAVKHNIRVILNPAPASKISKGLFSNIDIVIPNEIEASHLTGVKVVDLKTAETAARVLLDLGVRAVVVTLGDKGALLVSPAEKLYLPARKVPVIDTTAAGDAFVGGLAAALIQGFPLEESVGYATCAGAIAVTRFGAQTSLPTKEEVDQLFDLAL
jgi:ribokinase